MIKKSKADIRKWVQLFFFVVIGTITINHGLSELGQGWSWIPSLSIHSVCPFGGVVAWYQLAAAGTLVQKIRMSSVSLSVIAMILAVVFGPVLCGWICPFGTFQEWIGKLGRKIMGKRYNALIPARVDRILRFLRYGVLAWVIWITATSAKLIFASYDPYHALFNFWHGEAAISAMIILGIVIILSLFIERPWCKYACPYGALLGIFNLVSIFKIKRETKTCINCKCCDRACPMNITVSTAGTVRDHQCIRCYRCTSEAACPVPNTVNILVGRLKDKSAATPAKEDTP